MCGRDDHKPRRCPIWLRAVSENENGVKKIAVLRVIFFREALFYILGFPFKITPNPALIELHTFLEVGTKEQDEDRGR